MSDAPGCGAWAYARQAGIPTICYPRSNKPYLDLPVDTPLPLDTPSLINMLKHQLGIDYVILAGYLKVFKLVPQLYSCAWFTASMPFLSLAELQCSWKQAGSKSAAARLAIL